MSLFDFRRRAHSGGERIAGLDRFAQYGRIKTWSNREFGSSGECPVQIDEVKNRSSPESQRGELFAYFLDDFRRGFA
jgi:hypothetical protein